MGFAQFTCNLVYRDKALDWRWTQELQWHRVYTFQTHRLNSSVFHIKMIVVGHALG